MNIELIISILLIAFASFWILWPYFAKASEVSVVCLGTGSLKNEELVQALCELEADYQDGRLSEADYLAAKRELALSLDDPSD